MGDLIRPRVQMVSKDGELQIHITLDLNINGNPVSNSNDIGKLEEEKTEWAIPTFNSSEKIKFGKKS